MCLSWNYGDWIKLLTNPSEPGFNDAILCYKIDGWVCAWLCALGLLIHVRSLSWELRSCMCVCVCVCVLLYRGSENWRKLYASKLQPLQTSCRTLSCLRGELTCVWTHSGLKWRERSLIHLHFGETQPHCSNAVERSDVCWFVYLLKAYSPADRTGSPQGFPSSDAMMVDTVLMERSPLCLFKNKFSKRINFVSSTCTTVPSKVNPLFLSNGRKGYKMWPALTNG